MEFTYTAKDIEKVKKRRYRYEKKWKPFHTAQIVLLILAVVIPIIVYFYVAHQGEILRPGYYTVDVYTKEKIPASPWGPAFMACFIFAFFALLNRVIVSNMISRWVSDRFDEKLYVENGFLHHTYHYSVAGGALSWTTGKDMIEEVIALESIHNLKIDSKGGRIEFECTSSNMIYTDWERKIPQHEPRIVHDFKFIIYDFFKPSFIEYLKGLGIPYTEGSMDFKLINVVRMPK